MRKKEAIKYESNINFRTSFFMRIEENEFQTRLIENKLFIIRNNYVHSQ